MTVSLRRQYGSDCFHELCQFVRKTDGLPPYPALLAAAKRIGETVYWQKYRVLDNRDAIEFEANKNAKYVFENNDLSKGRAPPKSTRSKRNTRDKAIVDHYAEGNSMRSTATKFKISKSVVQSAVSNAKIRPLRAKKVVNLPPCALFILNLLESAVSSNGIYCFRASEIDMFLKNFIYVGEKLNLSEIVKLLNESNIDASLAICEGDALAFAKGRKYKVEALHVAVVKITDPNNNMRVHKFCRPLDPFRQAEFIDGIGLVLYCLTNLRSRPIPEMIEALWFRSFSFVNPERVRIAVRRALNTDNGMDAIENYARGNADYYRHVARAARLTRTCCALIETRQPATAISEWLQGSEMRSLCKPVDLEILEVLAKTPEPVEYEAFDASMIRLLRSSKGGAAAQEEPVQQERQAIREPLCQQEPAHVSDHDADDSMSCDEQEMRDLLDRELEDELGPRAWSDGEDTQDWE